MIVLLFFRDNESFPHIKDVSFANNPPYDKHSPDFRVPFFTLVEFISYMGWIKVTKHHMYCPTIHHKVT